MTARKTAFLGLCGLVLTPLILSLTACGRTEESPTPAPQVHSADDASSVATANAEEPDAAQEQAGWVTVRVLREADGALLPDVPIEIVWQASDEEAAQLKGVTKENGECRIPVVPGAMILQCAAMGTPLTAPIAETMMEEVLADQEYVVELTVIPAGVLGGIVIDESGEPIPQARVVVWHSIPSKTDGENEYDPETNAVADDAGRFMVGGLPPGPFTLAAVGEGKVALQRVSGVVESGQLHNGLELVLGDSHEVYGRVLSPDGLAFPAGLVVAGQPGRREDLQMTEIEDVYYLPSPQIVTRVDESGQFLLPSVPDGYLWNMSVRTREFLPWFGRIQPDQDFVEVVLSTGVLVSGRVLAPDGEPVHLADLRLFADRAPQTTTRKGGRFSFPAVAASDEALFLAYAPGFMPAILRPDMSQDEVVLAVELQPSQAIVGQLVDADGQPIPHAPIEIAFHSAITADLEFLSQVPPKKRPESIYDLSRSLTDEDGKFSFPDLYVAEFELWSPKFGKEARVLVRPGQADVVLIAPIQ